jgi:phosphatidate cytidylyltransferase
VDASDDDNELESGEGGPDDHDLPHWTEPGTGQVPRLSAAADDDLADWASLSAGPRWADDPDVSPAADAAVEGEPPPVRIGTGVEDDFFTYEESPRRGGREASAPRRAQGKAKAPRRAITERGVGNGEPAHNDLIMRIGTAAALAAVAIVCLLVGKVLTVFLIAAVLALAASEFYVSLQKVGYQPATLLGLTASVSLPLATYWRGEAAFGVVLFLTVVFGVLWYLLGVGSERPVPNLGVTLLGVVYIGLLGSFGSLLLESDDGVGLLLAAILLGVGYDVGGYFVGRNMGRSPLTEASPNKTVEGLIGGMLTTVGVSVVISVVGIGPFDGDTFGLVDAVLVGIAAAVMAPIGDLAESLMKRDLGLKDMGTILPGHGGVLDRFDAMLFVLPTTYYMVRLLA